MPLSVLKALYGVLVLFAAALSVAFYRRDLEDDLSANDLTDSFISLSFISLPPIVDRVFMILLGAALADGIWLIRNESWAMILILPFNAMWLWGTYVSSLKAIAKRRLRSSQKPASS